MINDISLRRKPICTLSWICPDKSGLVLVEGVGEFVCIIKTRPGSQGK